MVVSYCITDHSKVACLTLFATFWIFLQFVVDLKKNLVNPVETNHVEYRIMFIFLFRRMQLIKNIYY